MGNADRAAELTRMLCDLIGQYNKEHGTSKMKQMERDLEDVTDMMRDNITKVMERGERIESLIDKTALLKSESSSFRAQAKHHNDTLWWRDTRGKMIFGLFVAVVVCIGLWHVFNSSL